jgi:hypothetical protein
MATDSRGAPISNSPFTDFADFHIVETPMRYLLR